MNASQQLAEASEIARSGNYADAHQRLSKINPDDLNEEERQRLFAGREYVEKHIRLPPNLNQVIENLREASSDPQLWQNKPQTGGPAPYLSWPVVARLLDRHAPNWQVQTVNIIESERAFIVTVQLEINGVSRQASYRHNRFGIARDGREFEYTSPVESAERRAMVRAATLFGCGAEQPQRRQQQQRQRNRR